MSTAAPRALSALCMALSLATASALAQTLAETPAAPVAEAAPATTAVELPASPVHVEEAARLKGVSKVAIAGFQVYVITEQSAASTAQGGSAHSTIASVATDLKVEGLTAERLKALTNSLYDDTVRQLQAQGLAVVPHEQLQAVPAFAELKAAGATDGLAIDTRGGKGQVFAARDLPVLHMNEMGWLHRSSGGLFGGPKVEDAYVSLGDTVSSGFKIGAYKPPLQALAQAVDAPLLQVRLVLTAAQLKAKGNGFFSTTAKTEAAGLHQPLPAHDAGGRFRARLAGPAARVGHAAGAAQGRHQQRPEGGQRGGDGLHHGGRGLRRGGPRRDPEQWQSAAGDRPRRLRCPGPAARPCRARRAGQGAGRRSLTVQAPAGQAIVSLPASSRVMSASHTARENR